ncbi:MAG: M24 family metallopeptidase [Vicinamibacterales bacterium]|nr:M24 family metallopeptidase [Vicinamibacterales bacterium]HJO18516.1 M24 family metallopeptidase [Vicinamibacterales bacterium]|tara:strand:- start:54 stop:1448 length:1395 start_codon:yes stop_codon:yes gene_type:complete
MLRTLLLVILAVGFLWLPATSHGENPSVRDQQTPPYASSRPLGTLREQAAIQQAWLRERLETNLPVVMREHRVDMWVVSMREYNEDPVFRALVSPTSFAARRRTIYVFFDRGSDEGLERIALGGNSMGGLYEAYRTELPTATGDTAELWGADQWRLLAQLVRERNPRSIAVNISDEHNFADGLTAGEWEQMRAALGPDLEARVIRNPRLAIDYLAMRVPSMTQVYRRLQGFVHEIISAAFSNLVITPGVTTTEDVVWWMRQRVNDLGLHTWFQPSVSVQRRNSTAEDLGDGPVIQRGDVLHCDFGITAMGLNTDTQHMAYVLPDGETEAPEGLKRALARANRLQDILLDQTKVGMTGNEVLQAVLRQMRSEGLNGTMYSHPIGDHGHGAGPLIGLWDYQEAVPGRGDVPVIANMWYSTELQVTTPVAEWNGQPVRMALEEEAEITPDGEMRWMLRRQTELHLVR